MTAKRQRKSKTDETPTRRIHGSRIERYYSKVVAIFVVLTVLLVGLIAYFSFAKTTIFITPKVITQPLAFETTLQDLDGVIVLTDVEGSHEYTELNATEKRTGRASGTVTIFNNYSQSQPLVETTRLLSSDGVLFRTQETVTVPAGGSVEVAVAADKEGPTGDIGPSRFEVVALWEGLKDDIYAESSSPMTGGAVEVGVATATDLANAQAALRTQLEEQALQIFTEEVPGYEGLPQNPHLLETVTVVKELQNDLDTNEGDETDSITATQKITAAAAVVNADKLTQAIESQLDSVIPEGMDLVGDLAIDEADLAMTAITEDLTNATITVTMETELQISLDNANLAPEKLTNKTDGQVQSYLRGFDEISSVRLEFSPFWVTRTPGLAENITVRLE